MVAIMPLRVFTALIASVASDTSTPASLLWDGVLLVSVAVFARSLLHLRFGPRAVSKDFS